jgi:hypothetical protein
MRGQEERRAPARPQPHFVGQLERSFGEGATAVLRALT